MVLNESDHSKFKKKMTLNLISTAKLTLTSNITKCVMWLFLNKNIFLSFSFVIWGRSLHQDCCKSRQLSTGRPWPLQKFKGQVSLAKQPSVTKACIFSLLISLRHEVSRLTKNKVGNTRLSLTSEMLIGKTNIVIIKVCTM